jgi:hypothetical protein
MDEAAMDKKIADALKTMTSDERLNYYLHVNERTEDDDEYKINPQFRKQFNKIFHEYYKEEALIAREIMVKHMEPGLFARVGGKTRRNRRRRRNRRSLKRKCSKRR